MTYIDSIKTEKDVQELINHSDWVDGRWIGQYPKYKIREIGIYDLYLICDVESGTIHEVVTEKGEDIIIGINTQKGLIRCEFCEDFFEKSELKKVKMIGRLCCGCVDALKSRGETIQIIEN